MKAVVRCVRLAVRSLKKKIRHSYAEKEKNMGNEKNTALTFSAEGEVGYIRVSDEVVSRIAALAALEVDGVARLTSGMSGAWVAKRKRKGTFKGVHFIVENERFRIDISIVVRYGFNIVDVSKAVQERIRQALVTMTGLTPTVVNVRVSAIDFSEK